MAALPQRKPTPQRSGRPTGHDLLQAAYMGDFTSVQSALDGGVPVDTAHQPTGLTALHIAVGTDNIRLARYLIEDRNAPFGPDAFGRWPSVIAAECRTNFFMADYITDAEAAWLENNPPDSSA